MKRLILVCVMILCLMPLGGWAEPADGTAYSYQGAVWGMTRAEVRELVGMEPFQEPTAASGHSALVYQVLEGDSFYIVQYNFLPSDALYNIELMAPDADGAYYDMRKESYTALYGDPLTEADADIHADNAAAVMMAVMMQATGDTDFLGWQADHETVIVMSRDTAYHVCYVEIRRYTDFFLLE